MIIFDAVTKSYPIGKNKPRSLRDILSCTAESAAKNEGVFTSVDNVSFHIHPGDSVAILGRNGAGKSTLLKLLTRITLPTKGHIIVRGQVSCLLEVGASFHLDLTGRENIFLSGAMLGMRRGSVVQVVDDIINFSELGKFIDESVKSYSSGMFLRLAFSIGVYLSSEILGIDEALAVGDFAFRQRCLKKLLQLKEEGRTIFLVSHDIEQLTLLCDKGLVMENGKNVFYGDIASAIEIYEKNFERG